MLLRFQGELIFIIINICFHPCIGSLTIKLESIANLLTRYLI
nr:hypothetical protein CJLB15_00048 [Campylobacter phage CJLB-15]